MVKKPKNYRVSKAYAALKNALLEDLSARGLDDQAYLDKVDEYMDFWVRRQELRDDVSQRGLSLTDDKGRVCENRSVSLEIQVSRQMLSIFTALGFKADRLNIRQIPDDEDDL